MGKTLRQSMVLAVGHAQGRGMFAPLTSAGSLLVDGVSASTYATSTSMNWVSHRIVHVGFFPARMYQQFHLADLFMFCQGKGGIDGDNSIDDSHPLGLFDTEVSWRRCHSAIK